MDDKELLQQLLQTNKKQLVFMQIIALVCVLLVAVNLLAFAVLVPKLMASLQSIEAITQNLASVDWNQIAQDITSVKWDELSQNFNDLLTTIQPGLTDSLNNLSKIDFVTLNKAIADLQAMIAPLARMFGG